MEIQHTFHLKYRVYETSTTTGTEILTPQDRDKDNDVRVRKIIEGGYQILELPIPCLLSFAPTGIPPRKATLSGVMKARNHAKKYPWILMILV